MGKSLLSCFLTHGVCVVYVLYTVCIHRMRYYIGGLNGKQTFKFFFREGGILSRCRFGRGSF